MDKTSTPIFIVWALIETAKLIVMIWKLRQDARKRPLHRRRSARQIWPRINPRRSDGKKQDGEEAA